MDGWHHQLSGHGFGWTLGVGDGQGGLACCHSSPTTVMLKKTLESPLDCKLQYFGHLMQRTDSLGKTLMLGKIESRK